MSFCSWLPILKPTWSTGTLSTHQVASVPAAPLCLFSLGPVSVLASCSALVFPSEHGTAPWIPADLGVAGQALILRDGIAAHLSGHSLLPAAWSCLEEKPWSGAIASCPSPSPPCHAFPLLQNRWQLSCRWWKDAVSLSFLPKQGPTSLVYAFPLLSETTCFQVAKALSFLEVLCLRFLLWCPSPTSDRGKYRLRSILHHNLTNCDLDSGSPTLYLCSTALAPKPCLAYPLPSHHFIHFRLAPPRYLLLLSAVCFD